MSPFFPRTKKKKLNAEFCVVRCYIDRYHPKQAGVKEKDITAYGGLVTATSFRTNAQEIIENIRKNVRSYLYNGLPLLIFCRFTGIPLPSIRKQAHFSMFVTILASYLLVSSKESDQEECNANHRSALQSAAEALNEWLSYYFHEPE